MKGQNGSLYSSSWASWIVPNADLHIGYNIHFSYIPLPWTICILPKDTSLFQVRLATLMYTRKRLSSRCCYSCKGITITWTFVIYVHVLSKRKLLRSLDFLHSLKSNHTHSKVITLSNSKQLSHLRSLILRYSSFCFCKLSFSLASFRYHSVVTESCEVWNECMNVRMDEWMNNVRMYVYMNVWMYE